MVWSNYVMEYCESNRDRCSVIGSESKLLLHREDAFCLLFIPTTFLITILYQQVIVRGRQSATTPPPIRQRSPVHQCFWSQCDITYFNLVNLMSKETQTWDSVSFCSTCVLLMQSKHTSDRSVLISSLQWPQVRVLIWYSSFNYLIKGLSGSSSWLHFQSAVSFC